MLALNIIVCIVLAAIGFVAFFFLTLFLYSLTISFDKEYSGQSSLAWFYGRVICWGAFFFTGTHVKVKGLKKLPKGRFVYVANHRSKFDPMLVIRYFGLKHVAFISKDSNFKIPMIGKIIHRCNFLCINRDDPREALPTINKAVDLIKQDEISIGVYPEGTRSKTGQLGKFHSFVFRIPFYAQVPVGVGFTDKTEEIVRRFPRSRATINFEILDVLDVNYVSSHRPVEISERVEAIIKERLEKGE